jgi:hypothetical protein
METEYDGTGSGHEPYGEPGYGAGANYDGSPGAEVAEALVADLTDDYEAAFDGDRPGEHDSVGRPAEELAIHIVDEGSLDQDPDLVDLDPALDA